VDATDFGSAICMAPGKKLALSQYGVSSSSAFVSRNFLSWLKLLWGQGSGLGICDKAGEGN
jgi:hypothetical protein